MNRLKKDDAVNVTGVPKSLGLVAGLGVGAGVFYYRSLVNAHLERGLLARIVMVHADVRMVMRMAKARERQQLAEYLASLLQQMSGAGAEIATIPAFSPQVCAEELQDLTPLPLISLLDSIVMEVRRRKLRRVAILGAPVTMETELFGQLGEVAEVVSLQPDELERVGRHYTKIVETERVTPAEFDDLRFIAHRMVEHEDADAILLAGTDLSFVFNADNTDFPHVDGARTHIESIMQMIVGEVA